MKTNPSPLRPIRLLAAAVLFLSMITAPAATRTWLNAGGGNWSTPGNWSGGEVPTSEDTAFITLDGTYTVTVDQTAQFASLTLGGGTGTPTLRWTGGHLPGNITIQSGAVMRYALATFGSVFGDGTLNNHGTVIFESAATQTWALFGSSIVNQTGALIDLQADGTIGLYGGSPSIVNHGTIRKSGGTGIFYMGSVVPFTNRGTVEIQSGTLQFGWGFTSSSDFIVSDGALLDLQAGTFTLENGHNVSGLGGYGIFNSGSPVINGPITHTNFQLTSGVLYMTNELRGGIHWSGGFLSTELTITPTGVLTYGLTNFNVNHSGVITNHGLIRWAANADRPWSMSGGRIINAPGGVIDLQRDSTFAPYSGTPFIVNQGTLRKSGGTGFSTVSVLFTNAGLVEIQTGTLHFTDGFTSSGAFDVSDGALLDLQAGTFTLEPGHDVTGLGGYGIFNSGSPVINGPITHTNFQLTSGALYMTNELRGGIHWSGGFLSTELTITPTDVLTYGLTNFNVNHSGAITNHGLIRWATNADRPWSMSAASIVNAAGGVIDLQRDSTFAPFSGASFLANHGTLRKSGGTGWSTVSVPFTNSGTIEALSGILYFGGDFDMIGGLLKFGIAGDTDFGKMDVTGEAPLVGGIGAILLNGYIPPIDQTFEVMTFGSRNGAFADTSGLAVGSGRAFDPVYTATALSLRAVEVDDVLISQHPQSLTVIAGNPAEFSVVASGTGPLGYQWRRNGTPLPNTDTNRLVIPSAQLGNGGAYDVVITSSVGQATSHPATLTVHVPPNIAAPPADRTVATGETATFSVGATGVPAPTYQWFFNGQPIGGATSPDLDVAAAMAGNVGAYSVVVSNAAGSVTNTVHLALVDLRMFAGIIIDAGIGARYRVEFTTDINTPTTNWVEIGSVTVTNRPHFFFDLDSPGQPKRFYRAVPLPAP